MQLIEFFRKPICSRVVGVGRQRIAIFSFHQQLKLVQTAVAWEPWIVAKHNNFFINSCCAVSPQLHDWAYKFHLTSNSRQEVISQYHQRLWKMLQWWTGNMGELVQSLWIGSLMRFFCIFSSTAIWSTCFLNWFGTWVRACQKLARVGYWIFLWWFFEACQNCDGQEFIWIFFLLWTWNGSTSWRSALNPHHSTNSGISNLCIFMGHQESVYCNVFSFWFTLAFFHEADSGSNSTMSLYLQFNWHLILI